jgi:uncharacterized phage protein (TIGR01671 family)
MSREIKFRAWDKLYSKMHNGEDVYLALHGGRVIQDSYFTTESQCASVGFEDFIVDRQDQFELMQFTGLLDKSGKEIYEGDLLKAAKTGKIYPVEWDGRDAHFHAQEGQFILMSYNWQYAEVIGNIYENPELLAP